MSSIAERYYVVVRDQTYTPVALFDTWIDLSFHKVLNGVGSFALTLDANDSRIDLFELDGLVQIYRSVPGQDLGWYEEFNGLFRSSEYTVDESGRKIFIASGTCLNDFLARTIINYKEGTTRAYKNDFGQNCIVQYVYENCGEIALVPAPDERESNGVLKDFIVDPENDTGEMWEGDRAFQNLLDVIQDIAKLSNLYYEVWWWDIGKFWFWTNTDKLWYDRTTVGLDPNTGLNTAGFSPVIFSVSNGTLQSSKYNYDRTNESNVVSVLGDGDGATREVQVRSASTINDSPWNRREVSRPQNGFISEMQMAGDEALEELKAKEVISVVALQQPSQLYGKHYWYGDKVTASVRGTEYHRLVSEINYSSGNLAITLSET